MSATPLLGIRRYPSCARGQIHCTNNINPYYHRVIESLYALDPDSLSSEAAKAVEAGNREDQSANTARTYRTDLQYWGAWHVLLWFSLIDGTFRPY